MPPGKIPAELQQVLWAYSRGIFPMGEPDGSVQWYEPLDRGILPLENFHVPRSLAKTIRRGRYAVTMNRAFDRVIELCAQPGEAATVDRDETWINKTIQHWYRQLHRLGFAHSLEVWHGRALVGGLYGIAIQSLFAGESMFSLQRDASKVGLAALVAWMKAAGLELLDTQFYTEHLGSMGAICIPQAQYLQLLEQALSQQPAGLRSGTIQA